MRRSTCAMRSARTIKHVNPDGKTYRLNEKIAVLFMRPRGWHMVEKHVTVDGKPVSASLFDFGLYFFHNAKALLARGSAPYFYLPKMESHLEARLWNDVFIHAQRTSRHSARHRQGDGADRDHTGCFRNGRIPLRVARAFCRAELRTLGLHLQLPQEVRPQPGFHPRRPRPGEHDFAVHARLFAAVDQDLSPPQCTCHRRDGGTDPDQVRPGGK